MGHDEIGTTSGWGMTRSGRQWVGHDEIGTTSGQGMMRLRLVGGA